MAGERRVDERVPAVDELGHRPVVADEVHEEPDRLLEHRPPQLVVERREPAPVDAVVLLEPAEVEPVAAELRGQTAHAVVAEHPPGLRREYRRLVQVARRGVGEQLVVGHAGPEEVAQSAGQVVIRQRPDATIPARPVDPVAKVGRHEDAHDRVADGVLVAQAVRLAKLPVEVGHAPALPVRERTAVGPLGEPLDCLDVAGLRLEPFLLDATNRLAEDPELVLDGADRLVARPEPSSLRQVDRGEPSHLGLGHGVLVLGPDEVECLVAPQEAGLGALVPEVAGILAHRGARDEVELPPEPVQLLLTGLIQHQLVERAVVAEVAGHAVEAGAQESSGVPLLLLGVEVDRARSETKKASGNVRQKRPNDSSKRPATSPPSGAASPGGRVVEVQLAHRELRRPARVPHPVGHELAVLPEDERLRPLADPPRLQVLDLWHEPRRSSTTKSRIRSQPARAASG